MRPDAGIDFEVVIEKLTNHLRRFCLFHGVFGHFKSGKPELGNHVPIDGTQSLISKESAGAASEGLVVEDALVNRFNLLLL